ncbi:MAG: exodeoxyribonuclease V subunit gamma, partial [Methylococcales bacterium]
IALLGMNEGEFPKIDQSPTFDLLSLKEYFRKGDRSRRIDDRYQFLEILLSTRQQLLMTYIGQSIANNETIFPSVVISELLEVLQDSYQLQDLTIREPLQSFSHRYFNGSSRLVSFSSADCDTAKALQTPEIKPTDWWQGELMTEESSVIDLADLLAFYQHPQRYFMRQQLSVRFQGISAQTEECEPFVIDKMDGYSIYHDWIKQRLLGENLSVKKLQAQGRWLSGVLGELEFVKQQTTVEDFVTRIQEKNLGAPIEEVAIDIHVNQYRLIGKLGCRYEKASLIYRYADLKGKDFINALLQHCVLNQLAPQSTYCLSTDEDIVFLPEQGSAELLASLVDIYCAGQQTPNAFFVEAALVYVKQAQVLKTSTRASKPAIAAAKEWLDRAVLQAYEPELKRLYQDMANRGDILDEHFEQQCQSLLQPIWDAVH